MPSPPQPATALADPPPARSRSATLSGRPGPSPAPSTSDAAPPTLAGPSAGGSPDLSSLGAANERSALTASRPSTGLRRNRSLNREVGSFLHAHPDPSPIPPSLQNSPYLQDSSSPFARRAWLGRAKTSSVVPTLKSLNVSTNSGGHARSPSSSPVATCIGLSNVELVAAVARSPDANEHHLQLPPPSPPMPPSRVDKPTHQRPSYDRKRRAVSDSCTSSGISSGHSSSSESDTETALPRTPVLGSTSGFDLTVLPPLAARHNSAYPVMTGSGKVHPPGKPTVAALSVHSGFIAMERIEPRLSHVALADPAPASSSAPLF